MRYRDGVLFNVLSLSPPDSPIDIGRTDECTVRIKSDPLVSRRHARLVFAAGWWSVEDADSHNGTFVGHRRIPGETILGDGACFRVGDTVLSVHLPQSGSAQPAPGGDLEPRLLDPNPMQRKILVALARPWLAGYDFPVAASDDEMAHAFDCDVTAVSAEVGGLYDQAGLSSDVDQRGGLIALAMHERTVTPDDL